MTSVLRRKVLVLNRNWNAIAVVDLERAICLCVGTFKGTDEPKARIIDPTQDFRLYTWADWRQIVPRDGEDVVRSASQPYRIPKVILLSRYNKLRHERVHFNRRTIYKRDSDTDGKPMCQYCGAKPGTKELNLDHVIPRCQGGQSTWENVVVSCVRCNTRKAGKTPAQAGMRLLRKPFKPKHSFYRGDYWCKDWDQFIKPEELMSIAYWETELESDN